MKRGPQHVRRRWLRPASLRRRAHGYRTGAEIGCKRVVRSESQKREATERSPFRWRDSVSARWNDIEDEQLSRGAAPSRGEKKYNPSSLSAVPRAHQSRDLVLSTVSAREKPVAPPQDACSISGSQASYCSVLLSSSAGTSGPLISTAATTAKVGPTFPCCTPLVLLAAVCDGLSKNSEQHRWV